MTGYEISALLLSSVSLVISFWCLFKKRKVLKTDSLEIKGFEVIVENENLSIKPKK